MTRTRWIILAIVAAVAIVVVGGYVAWDQFLRGDQVAPLALPSTVPGSAAGTGPAGSSAPAGADASAPGAPPPDGSFPAGGPGGPAGPGGPGGASGTAAPSLSFAPAVGSAGGAPSAANLAGSWTVTNGSVVGYRVREQLGGVTALTDAVGRTSSVTGQATLAAAGDGTQVTAASFTADVTTLASDKGMRDQRIHQMGLESDRYPTATFTLSAPVAVPVEALPGATVDVTLTGDLAIHGTTKSVSIPAKARLADGVIEVAGSLAFPFADFGMTPPSVGDFVKVQPDATLEFLLRLAKG